MDVLESENSWEANSLFNKAKLYVDEMEEFDTKDWKYGLFSTFVLEFLARATLSHVSPTLLADSKNSWQHIYYALGRQPTINKYIPRSISINEVFDRIGNIFSDFTQENKGFCVQHIDRRNSELHSGALAFAPCETSEWIAKYYRASGILLNLMDKEISDFFGDSPKPLQLIESMETNVIEEVNQLVSAHKRVWTTKPDDEREGLILLGRVRANRHQGHLIPCPACNATALLSGDPSGPVTKEINSDVIVERQSIVPVQFQCYACDLRISGLSRLNACGLGEPFTMTTDYSAADYFGLYTEDEIEEARNEIIYEPDFNE